MAIDESVIEVVLLYLFVGWTINNGLIIWMEILYEEIGFKVTFCCLSLWISIQIKTSQLFNVNREIFFGNEMDWTLMNHI